MGRSRYIAINFCLILLVYQDVAALAATWGIVDRRTFPNPASVRELFMMYGVFNGVQRESRRYHAFGLRERLDYEPRSPLPEMVDLEIYRYFPQSRGEANRRLGFFGYVPWRGRRLQSYREMASMIRRIHNQAHPDDPMEQVFIYLARWPVDPRGYYYREDEHKFKLRGFD